MEQKASRISKMSLAGTCLLVALGVFCLFVCHSIGHEHSSSSRANVARQLNQDEWRNSFEKSASSSGDWTEPESVVVRQAKKNGRNPKTTEKKAKPAISKSADVARAIKFDLGPELDDSNFGIDIAIQNGLTDQFKPLMRSRNPLLAGEDDLAQKLGKLNS